MAQQLASRHSEKGERDRGEQRRPQGHGTARLRGEVLRHREKDRHEPDGVDDDQQGDEGRDGIFENHDVQLSTQNRGGASLLAGMKSPRG